MGKLQFRLLASFTLVIFVAMGAVLFLLNQTTKDILENRQAEEMVALSSRMQSALTEYYTINRDWDGIEPYIEQWGNIYELKIILTDTEGSIIVDSDNKLTGTYTPDSGGIPLTTLFRTYQTGILYITPKATSSFSLESIQILFNAIGQYFIVGGIVSIAVAIILSYILSRRVLSPVKELTGAARKLGKGDLSQRVRVNEQSEFGELAETFNSMAANLEKAEELRKNMVADIAHELRTPLTNIKGYLEAVLDGVVQPSESTIRNLDEEATLLARLVSDLQELSLAEAGELKLQMQPADIGQIIGNTCELMQTKAVQKKITLRCEIDNNLPVIPADPQRIGQVLRNLITNALTATPHSGSVSITAGQKDGFIEVSIADSGEGISPENLERIFERFYRVDKSRARATGGTGLGLTIARRLIEAHHGTMRAESEPGKGSRFIFTLPLG
jgi:signal transduction histidine kinase